MALSTVHEIDELLMDIKQDAEKLVKCLKNDGNMSNINCVEHAPCLEAQIKDRLLDMTSKTPVVCMEALQDTCGDQKITCVNHEKCLLAQYLQNEKKNSSEVMDQLQPKSFSIDSQVSETEFDLKSKEIGKDEIMSNFSDILDDSKQFVERFPCQKKSSSLWKIFFVFFLIFWIVVLFNKIYCDKNSCVLSTACEFKLCAHSWYEKAITY